MNIKTLVITVMLAGFASQVTAAVLYSGGNPIQNHTISGMAWNYYSMSNTWSRPYVGAVVAAGDQWTVTGLEFYEAIDTPSITINSVMWDIRTSFTGMNNNPLPASVAEGAVTGFSYVDTNVNMTGGIYDYDIYKFTVNFDTPVVLAGGQTYYFTAQLNRGRFPDDLNTAMMFANGTGRVGTAPDTITDVWYTSLGSPNSDAIYSTDLAFSVIGTSLVPEPGSLALLGAAGSLLTLRRRRSLVA